uniref:carbonic anhydrase n=1 Tax=Phreagena okutanii TaxID=1298646 RepID=A0A146I9J4_9BIVA|nr:putative two domain conserved membrane-associated carbonic anhydrase [Phreagena okutanii]
MITTMELLLLCLFSGTAFASESSWSYTDSAESWNMIPNSKCGDKRQSPINIPWELEYSNYSPFEFTGYDDMQAYGLRVENNGHTAQINIDPSSIGHTKVSGGGLAGTYIAIQLHFHWGRNDLEGSEHTFRGHHHALELHVVHFKESYGTVSEAVKHDDGLAVLGFFFTTNDAEENENLKPLIDSLDTITFQGQNKSIDINFSDLMPTSTTHFYRYRGSLTTPTCDEVVVWTIFDHVNTISSAQIKKFRELYEGKANEVRHHIAWNYRPTQSLLHRTVYKNYQSSVPDSWHWGYEGAEGADNWKTYYMTCSGVRQSPINIPSVNNETLADFNPDLELDTLEFRNYDQPLTGIIKNNGHTIQVDINQTNMYLTNGGLDGNYTAAQFHFHWGHDDHHGSEHTHNGKSYPLELHIVHYKEEYKDLAGAIGKDDGLAVVGFFIEAGGISVNRNYGTIISALSDVKYKGASKVISGFSLTDITSSNMKTNATAGYHLPYYRYTGGLTTPPCLQIVTWSVMKTPIHLTSEQIAEFRKVSHITSGPIGSHDHITKNNRPTQDLVTRLVYQSYDFRRLSTDAASGLLPSILTLSAILFVLMSL